MKVLIVEDEKRLAQALEYILRQQKFYTDVVYNGNDAYDYASSMDYDVIVLDVMLPGMNGFDVAKKLRQDKNEIPILMLTARGATSDKVGGLNSGADDYMTKPFEPEELIARLNALTRRHGAVIIDELSFGDIRLDLNSSELICGAESIKLNYKEFAIMKLFMLTPSSILTKDKLIDDVWGFDSDAVDNNVEAYISFLRKKLKFVGSAVVIRNQQKLGYRLEAHSC